jgi:hypothetical protein
MRKRKKVLVILGLIVLAAVLFVMLKSPDEPEYQGRYLSEWIEALPKQEAERAVQAIGTNGIPYYFEWMHRKSPRWRMSFVGRLPRWIQSQRIVFQWRSDSAGRKRASDSLEAFRILGPNAASAVPELKSMLGDPEAADRVIKALVHIGEDGIPALESAFADPQQINRWHVLWGLSEMVRAGHTNRCLPTLVTALADADVHVRLAATNFVQRMAPHILTNNPADEICQSR